MQVVEIEKPESQAGDIAAAAAKKKKNKKKKGKGGGGAEQAAAEDEETPGGEEVTPVPPPAAEEPVASDASAVPEDGDAAPDATGKKKKKKKGGGGGGGGGSAGGGGSSGALPPLEDGSARFQSALDALKSVESAASFTKSDLSQCGFGDKKLRQLLAALRGLGPSCVLTSLDLSHNSISDAGATALCTALGSEENVAPQLASLSLNANALSEAAASQCAAALATRPALALVLPEQTRPGGGGRTAVTADAAPVLDEYFAGRDESAVEAANASGSFNGGGGGGMGADGRPMGDEEERPLLIGPPLSLDAAIAILEKLEPSSAGDSVAVCDALQSLVHKAEQECAQLAASGSQNAKFLPRGLKWCAQHTAVLGGLLRPPPRPRVSYGAGDSASRTHGGNGFGDRLGRRRLLVIELITCLIGARRPPLTSALAEAKPSLVCLAVALVSRHPSSAILGSAVRRLVGAACQAKPLRASMLTSYVAAPSAPPQQQPPQPGPTGDLVAWGSVPSLQEMIALGLLSADGRPNRNLFADTSIWVELATALETLGGSDKQVAEKLAGCPEWMELTSKVLPAMRAGAPPSRWACGDPPAKEGASVIGAGSEMGELLRLLQMNKK